MIRDFLARYQIEIAVEHAERNPMGPDSWQPYFNHYAIWFGTTHGEMPIYVSTPGALPAAEVTVGQIAAILYYTSTAPNFAAWCGMCHLPPTEDTRFYYNAVQTKLRDFARVLTVDGLDELLRIGATL
jgi:hypothetical protein